MPPIAVALDWTPNVNHAGFFVALARGYFADRGLDVTFSSPHSDGYAVTPAQKLAASECDLAVCPSESIISYACQAHLQGDASQRLRAVAAVLANDTSAIVALKSSGVTRPKDLDGKKYASYGARYEGRIVQQMIRNDGGAGEFQEDTSMNALGIMDGLLQGKADATWVFMGWEGVLARAQGVELVPLSLDEYKVPYGYTPVLAAREAAVSSPHEKIVVRRFLEAAALGWDAVAADPAAAAKDATDAIQAQFSDLQEPVELATMQKACEYVASHVKNGDAPWGTMQGDRWSGFLDWLSDKGLLTSKKQSRRANGHGSNSNGNAADIASLDDLRGGNAGEPIPRQAIAAEDLFTNDLLPHELKVTSEFFARKSAEAAVRASHDSARMQ